MGDADGELTMLPSAWAQDGPVAMVRVRGCSMIDAGIEEGDYVLVRYGQHYEDGDVLMVSLDGECTVKSFFRDADGHPWLVPCNKELSPIDPTQCPHVHVLGKVVRVSKEVRRTSYRYLMERVGQWKAGLARTGPASVLMSAEAMKVWAALREAGIVGTDYKADAAWKNAVIADELGAYLKIRNKWETFCEFWDMNNLRSSMTNKKNDAEMKSFRKYVKGVIRYKR